MRFNSFRNPRALWTASVVIALLLGAAFGPAAAEAAKTAMVRAQQYGNWAVAIKGTPSVTVANQPTVNAVQSGSWTASLANTPTVVSQGPTRTPVVVADQDISAPSVANLDLYTVPSNKWLVLTDASIEATYSSAAAVPRKAELTAGGAAGFASLIEMSYNGAWWQGSLRPGQGLIAPPGSVVHIQLTRLGTTGSLTSWMTASGYLVDRP